jgi:L-seryl-tRNA(Ser) seleniumtransferase
MTLAALRATLLHFLRGDYTEHVPVWRMIAASAEELRARAEALAAATGGQAIATRSAVGGGSLPGEEQASWGIAYEAPGADALAARLRLGDPAVVGRVADGRVILDVRTVLPGQDSALAAAVSSARAG